MNSQRTIVPLMNRCHTFSINHHHNFRGKCAGFIHRLIHSLQFDPIYDAEFFSQSIFPKIPCNSCHKFSSIIRAQVVANRRFRIIAQRILPNLLLKMLQKVFAAWVLRNCCGMVRNLVAGKVIHKFIHKGGCSKGLPKGLCKLLLQGVGQGLREELQEGVA